MTLEQFNNFVYETEHRTERESNLTDRIDELFIADAENLAPERSSGRYRIYGKDIARLFRDFSDLPYPRRMEILEYQCMFWRTV